MSLAARGCLVVLALALVSAVASHPALSDEPAPVAGEVQQILDVAWKPSAGKFAAAQQHYEQAKKLAPHDVRVPYAMALVALKNLNAKDAAAYLDEALQSDNPLLPIRRVKIWHDVLHKNRATALDGIHKLVRVLTDRDELASKQDYQESARFLGIILGYYAGPGSSDMPAADREALAADVERSLHGPLADALADGKTAAGQQFKTLEDQLAAARKDIKARNAAKMAADLRECDTQIADVNRIGLDAQTQLMQVRKERNANEIEARYNSLKTKLDEMESERRDFENEKDSKGGLSMSGERGSHVSPAQISALKQELSPLIPLMQQIQTQSAPLRQQLNEQLLSLQALERKRKQINKPPLEDDNETRTMDIKLKLITTYAEIDLDQEKARILNTYSPK